MKIALTGSSGLIGQALGAHLAGAGHEVVHLVRSQHSAVDATHCWWDPDRGIMQLEKLSGVTALVHLAGRSIADRRWSRSEKQLIYHSRVAATERLCASLAKLPTPLELMVCASAVGIYGSQGDRVLDESQAPPPLPANNTDPSAIDAVIKLSGVDFLVEVGRRWEAAAAVACNHGIPVVATRFGVVLSPQGGALAKMLPLFRWGLGSNLGNGQQYWSWIAIEDVVGAIDWLIERRGQHAGFQAYNLTAPEPVTNARFTEVLARRLGRTRFLPVPSLALRLGLGEMADAALLASCRAVPQRLLSEGFQFKFSELATALQAMDM